jgi:hypothetical protein
LVGGCGPMRSVPLIASIAPLLFALQPRGVGSKPVTGCTLYNLAPCTDRRSVQRDTRYNLFLAPGQGLVPSLSLVGIPVCRSKDRGCPAQSAEAERRGGVVTRTARFEPILLSSLLCRHRHPICHHVSKLPPSPHMPLSVCSSSLLLSWRLPVISTSLFFTRDGRLRLLSKPTTCRRS